MKQLFSTDDAHPRYRFRFWREIIHERIGPVDLQCLTDGPFEGRMEAAYVGSLLIKRTSYSPSRAAINWNTLRNFNAQSALYINIKLAGETVIRQDDREAVQKPGDLVIFNSTPAAQTSLAAGRVNQSLHLELPRERLERVLGPARQYTNLKLGADLASTRLATTFFQELVLRGDDMSPDTAARMSSIGIDLIIASVAERIAKELPWPLHGSVVVQRAKAYVEAHLGDATLDPPHLAAAMGVSLRRLQELFHERSQHISDWIWQRRLATAAKRLADPACLHVPIGTLAYDCGFTTQAHFSRRFKDRYGVTPREYRVAAALKARGIVSDP